MATYMLFASLVFAESACHSKQKTNDMRTDFIWDASVACPKNYPCEIKYGYVGFGNNGDRMIISGSYPDAGIGYSGGGALTAYDVNYGFPVPNSAEILWVSYTEKKFYKLDVKFPKELQERMLQLFREGFYDYSDQKYYRYDNLVLSLLPGGVVWLHLDASARYVCLDYPLQAKEVQMRLSDFIETRHKTMDEFCTGRLSDYPEAIENLKKNGIPYNLWNRYAERFAYTVKFEYENQETISDPDFGYIFANGEYFRGEDRVQVEELSRIKALNSVWQVGEVKYTGYFYFDEDEVLDIFDKAYRKHLQQKGEFLIWVSKYNNRFKITLRVGEREYEFKKTKIHVFKQGVNRSDYEAVVFYNNHREIHSSDIKFVGE
jgi:hypothetical protein